jgi:hypothetical protein
MLEWEDAMQALSRQLETGGQWRLGVSDRRCLVRGRWRCLAAAGEEWTKRVWRVVVREGAVLAGVMCEFVGVSRGALPTASRVGRLERKAWQVVD